MEKQKITFGNFDPFSGVVDFFLKRAKLGEKSLREKYSTKGRMQTTNQP